MKFLVANEFIFQPVDSPRHHDNLDEADEDKDEGGAGHVRSEPGVHLFGILRMKKEQFSSRNSLTHTHAHTKQ